MFGNRITLIAFRCTLNVRLLLGHLEVFKNGQTLCKIFSVGKAIYFNKIHIKFIKQTKDDSVCIGSLGWLHGSFETQRTVISSGSKALEILQPSHNEFEFHVDDLGARLFYLFIPRHPLTHTPVRQCSLSTYDLLRSHILHRVRTQPLARHSLSPKSLCALALV